MKQTSISKWKRPALAVGRAWGTALRVRWWSLSYSSQSFVIPRRDIPSNLIRTHLASTADALSILTPSSNFNAIYHRRDGAARSKLSAAREVC